VFDIENHTNVRPILPADTVFLRGSKERIPYLLVRKTMNAGQVGVNCGNFPKRILIRNYAYRLLIVHRALLVNETHLKSTRVALSVQMLGGGRSNMMIVLLPLQKLSVTVKAIFWW
jgi:hypothetical protein